MPSTYTRLLYHIVFSTKHRIVYIDETWRARLHQYLGGTIRELGGIPHAVGGVGDHVHLLVTLKPTHLVSTVLREVKKSSSRWVHEEIRERRFAWQEGYGAFTVSRWDLARVKHYVDRQEEHHRTSSFEQEYRGILQRQGVEFEDRYLW
jgi:putative transposase